MGFRRYIKDPDAVLDYGFDWSDWLATDETISSATWTVPDGITEDSTERSTTATKVWLSGGTVGSEYTVACKVVTSDGRTDERSFVVEVVNR